MVLSNQVDMVSFWIINDFMKPNNIRMFKAFQYFKLLFYAIVSRFIWTIFFLLKMFFVHFLKRVAYLSFMIFAENNWSKLTLTKFFNDLVLIDVFFILHWNGIELSCTDHWWLSSFRSLFNWMIQWTAALNCRIILKKHAYQFIIWKLLIQFKLERTFLSQNNQSMRIVLYVSWACRKVWINL